MSEGHQQPEQYEVEAIVADRQNGQSEPEYKVRWKGYGPSDDTWEPESSLLDLAIFTNYLNAQDIYEVEAIVDDRKIGPSHSEREYRVRWRGYGPSDDIWETQSNLFHLEVWRVYERNRLDRDL